MAIFKCQIRKIRVSEHEILVEALSEEDAKSYLQTNTDWHEDELLDDGWDDTQSLAVHDYGIREIHSVSQIPRNYGDGNRAWNGKESVVDLLQPAGKIGNPA